LRALEPNRLLRPAPKRDGLRERERGHWPAERRKRAFSRTGRNISVEDPKPDVRSDLGHHEEVWKS
jgi:hypothetical protein